HRFSQPLTGDCNHRKPDHESGKCAHGSSAFECDVPESREFVRIGFPENSPSQGGEDVCAEHYEGRSIDLFEEPPHTEAHGENDSSALRVIKSPFVGKRGQPQETKNSQTKRKGVTCIF